jgi:magnesium transporter
LANGYYGALYWSFQRDRTLSGNHFFSASFSRNYAAILQYRRYSWIQAVTVTIRGIGVGEVTSRDTLKILRKEILAGLGTAVALGSTMVLLALIWTPPQERWVALVAGLVMAINSVVAVTLGTLLPMGMKRLKLDPAIVSGPLVTTMLDTIGFILFLTLITMSLNVLHLKP